MHEDFARSHAVKASGNRAFGAVFAAFFVIVGLWPLFSHQTPRWWSIGVAAAILLVTAARPSLLAGPSRLWASFGMLLQRVTSPVILALIFYVFVTPVGLLMQRLGHSAARLRRDASIDSYWIKRDPPGPAPDSMPNQF